jgi:DNA repair photolyase
MADRTSTPKGRGTGLRTENRFQSTYSSIDWEQLADEERLEAIERPVPTEYLPDATQRIICENDSPDVGFRFSINPYRGCEHGCAYCYARPSHEMLAMNAGIDFETKIIVKHDAPKLLREELSASSWRGETIAVCGNTDCYQPAERKFRITRGCLEVMLEARQTLGIITKNSLVLRDIDLLAELARLRLAHVFFSITTLRPDVARVMEPRTATPQAKLRAIRELTAAGVPCGIMVAPIVPGLTDNETPAILSAAKEAGAISAGYVLLRLPWAVRPIFEDWLTRNFPLQADRVKSLVRSTRDGKMYQTDWGLRQRGSGAYAKQIGQNFKVFAHKLGLDQPMPERDTSLFQPPKPESGQLRLF